MKKKKKKKSERARYYCHKSLAKHQENFSSESKFQCSCTKDNNTLEQETDELFFSVNYIINYKKKPLKQYRNIYRLLIICNVYCHNTSHRREIYRFLNAFEIQPRYEFLPKYII